MKKISLIAFTAVSVVSCTTTDKVKDKGSDIKKVEKDRINATLNCGGKSALNQLSIAGEEQELNGIACKVTRLGSKEESELIIGYKASYQGDTVQARFHLFGVENFQIKPAKYNVNTNLTDKFGKLYIEKGNPKVIQEITVYKGVIEILDYGMNSNVICGSIDLKDDKGNVIKGVFNEVIGSGIY